MPRLSAGDLYYRVAFEARTMENPDSPADYGNTESTWVELFSCRAEFIHLRGGEDVMAARLQGRHLQVIRVRASDETDAVTTDNRIVDMRNGDILNIRDVTHDTDRRCIDFLCEKGVAT
jgi:hypothetical protein